MTLATTTTTFTFHCIFRSIYIRQLIFNQIGDISNRLYPKDKSYDGSQRSLQGRDIIKLPLLEMISKFGLPWHFVCHYLPKDRDQVLLKRRRRVISQYCCHHNATLDTLEHLVEWSPDVGFDWMYLKYINNQELLEYLVKSCPTQEKYNFFKKAMEVACTNGYLSTVKLITCSLIKGAPSSQVDHQAMDIACRKGFIDIVKYLHYNAQKRFLHFNRSEGATTNAMDWAAENGQYEVVKYLQEHRSEGATTKAMDEAARNGHYEIVKYLSEHHSQSEGAINKRE
ncbi:hypothetical protein DFA_04420 [Cavenderia fasciculata]|uniref:Ankyrin repeat-containing protein n=1 Tax=Cavenderia fasciculata TaxID=261658 RepID=F4PPI9_CACFS|nr:uncharacterized protein DFA_04420 [Cavenderia fasciculata]EGG22302.1 hypothetical protein DFA_04420 [Cavenderia fasciculata]|eukprot:XP_004360153.1 hypothetical protein DFA_04420 [Cavenderia fasciculata]